MFAALHIPYNQTKSFSKIVLDYLDEAPALRPFYSHSPNLEGIKAAIEDRKKFPTDRHTLVDVLKQQYNSVEPSPVVQANLAALLADNTFTICTAHQPNIFTGPLYFIYKILHSIKLADSLKNDLPQYNFVPVYYMGSEDADFAELNHIYLQGKKYEWNTAQKGAVGRMVIDKALIQLIDELAGQLSVEKWGEEFIDLLRRCYRTGTTIQQATFEIVNALFGEYGLIVLIADNAALKRQMQPVFEDDLFNQRPSIIVEETCKIVSEHYNVQANPREINLFYLKDDIRERIESTNSQFVIRNSQLTFTEEEMRMELEAHPERFSPNVILRGLYQETILPNIAFIGGGGELAYWLQLRDLFQAYAVPFPVLVLRNSFLIVEDKWQKRIERLGLTITDFFKTEDELMKMIVDKHSGNFISLNGNFEKAADFFAHLQEQASAIDPTLAVHVAALKTRSFKTLQELEKKMLRAEKRKYADQQRQIQTIKSALFPDNGLQERKENIGSFYAKWGKGFIADLLNHSLSLEQKFTIII